MVASPAEPISFLSGDRDEQILTLVDRETLVSTRSSSRQNRQRGELVIRVVGPPPRWFGAVTVDLDRILALEDGWDSYGARRVQRRAVSGLLKLLEDLGTDVHPPGVYPVASGNILIEWNSQAGDLEIEIEGEHALSFVARDAASGVELEQEGITHERFLSEFLPGITRLIPRR